jgi:hypothetical protein
MNLQEVKADVRSTMSPPSLHLIVDGQQAPQNTGYGGPPEHFNGPNQYGGGQGEGCTFDHSPITD